MMLKRNHTHEEQNSHEIHKIPTRSGSEFSHFHISHCRPEIRSLNAAKKINDESATSTSTDCTEIDEDADAREPNLLVLAGQTRNKYIFTSMDRLTAPFDPQPPPGFLHGGRKYIGSWRGDCSQHKQHTYTVVTQTYIINQSRDNPQQAGYLKQLAMHLMAIMMLFAFSAWLMISHKVATTSTHTNNLIIKLRQDQILCFSSPPFDRSARLLSTR
jgi:hypothetical protein